MISPEGRRAVRHSTLVVLGGQLERVLGTVTAFSMRWLMEPAQLGVYTGLRIYLDNTNRSSLGIGQGAIQEVPILRASGRDAEAKRLADVAFTITFAASLLYGLVLGVWLAIRPPTNVGDPYANLWTWGLLAMAALAPIKRYQDFLTAILRAHQEFALVTRVQVLDAVVFAAMAVFGLWFFGFWGLIGAVGALMVLNIVYMHACHPLRFRIAWDWPTASRLLKVGMPIWINVLIFSGVSYLDRLVILWMADRPEESAGLYTIAIMGTSWSLDLAGRIVLVMYTYFQSTLGRTRDIAAVAAQAAKTVEAQAPLLFAGSAVAYLVGPVFLGTLMPLYAPGLPALRPLLPGMLLMGLMLAARQMLITIERPGRLALATLIGLAVMTCACVVGVQRAGIVGVAWGTTIGSVALYLLTTIAAYAPALGWQGWLAHQGRLVRSAAGYAAAALVATYWPLPFEAARPWTAFALRCAVLAALGLPMLWLWGRRHGWGGAFARKSEEDAT